MGSKVNKELRCNELNSFSMSVDASSIDLFLMMSYEKYWLRNVANELDKEDI